MNDIILALHPDLFRSSVDSVIQQAREMNRVQQGLSASDPRTSDLSPDELALEINKELGRWMIDFPDSGEEPRIVTYPDDVRAVFHKGKFLMEEELRRARYKGDKDVSGN